VPATEVHTDQDYAGVDVDAAAAADADAHILDEIVFWTVL
jgi:hypothetical protein